MPVGYDYTHCKSAGKYQYFHIRDKQYNSYIYNCFYHIRGLLIP